MEDIRSIPDKVFYEEVDRRQRVADEQNRVHEELLEGDPTLARAVEVASRPNPFTQDEDGKWNAICSSCKKDTKVPFKPKPEWPVYCLECYKKRKGDEK